MLTAESGSVQGSQPFLRLHVLPEGTHALGSSPGLSQPQLRDARQVSTRRGGSVPSLVE